MAAMMEMRAVAAEIERELRSVEGDPRSPTIQPGLTPTKRRATEDAWYENRFHERIAPLVPGGPLAFGYQPFEGAHPHADAREWTSHSWRHQARDCEAGCRALAARLGEETAEAGGALEWLPASAFPKAMRPRLRQAARPGRQSKRVRTETDDEGTKLYCLQDVARHWPGDYPPPDTTRKDA